MVEGDQTTTLVVGVFGRGRPSRAEVAPTVASLGDVRDPFVFPFVPGLSAGVRAALQDARAFRAAAVHGELVAA